MKPGHGNAHIIHDIASGIAKAELQRRYSAGAYGKAGERFMPETVAKYWRMLRGKTKGEGDE